MLAGLLRSDPGAALSLVDVKTNLIAAVSRDNASTKPAIAAAPC
jgi:hypothetical protein